MPSDRSSNPAASARIESWKEIAAFFGRDERTVKRWEKTRRLPVHRLPGEKGGVFAYKVELTSWLDSGAAERSSATADPSKARDAVPEGTAIEVEYGEEAATSRLTEGEPAERGVETPFLAGKAEPSAATQEGVLGDATHDGLPAVETPAPAYVQANQRRHSWNYLLIGVSIVVAAALLYPAIRRSLSRPTTRTGIATLDAAHATPEAAHVVDPAAQELYLKGRYYWNHRTDESLKLALGAFTQTIVRDPQYAPAYAGLADTYNLMTQYSFMPHAQAFPLALAAARKAVALDDSLSEAHRALAFGLFYWEWQTAEAFREYQRAIDLNPRDVEAHNWYATSLLVANQLPRAAEQIEKARELDPTSRIVLANQALILANSGESTASIARLRELESAEPGFLAPPQYLAEIFFARHDYPEYLAELDRVAATSHDPEKKALASAAKRGWTRGGSAGMLKGLRAAEESSIQAGKSSSYDLANICALLGDKPAADKYLKAAVDACDFNAMQAVYGAFNQIMQGDAAFESIKRQIELRMQRTGSPVTASVL
jgi:tetratricopeptide (TPR) repeat protein